MGFIAYAALYKLIVSSLGMACVYMGYKLFIMGVMPGAADTETDDEKDSAPDTSMKLTLQNAAPGGVLAGFGMILILVVLAQGSPESNRTFYTADQQYIQTLRGDGAASPQYADMVNEGNRLKTEKLYTEALKKYQKVLTLPGISSENLVDPLLGMAEIKYIQGEFAAAEAYANLANEIETDNANGIKIIDLINKAKLEKS